MSEALKIAIMQPYFLPYIGYWQLIQSVDKFVIYDDVEFSKGGWINRNRFLKNGKDEYFTIPLRKDSDFLKIGDRHISDSFFEKDRFKLLRKIISAYNGAANYKQGCDIVQKCFECSEKRLFDFIKSSIFLVCDLLNIKTEIVTSSSLKIDSSLRKHHRVIEICKKLGADTYINPIGGVDIYSKDVFKAEGVEIFFQKTDDIFYSQFGNEFVPNLSVVDMIMFNDLEFVKHSLSRFKLL